MFQGSVPIKKHVLKFTANKKHVFVQLHVYKFTVS